MCVDTGCIALNDHSEVEIVLSIRNGKIATTYRIPATVNGRDEAGREAAVQGLRQVHAAGLAPYITRH